MIYLDNAATTGRKPNEVVVAVNNALRNFSVNPGRNGHRLSISAAEKIFRIRQKTANLFGCQSPENVVFTLNCTHAINFVLKGMLKSKDHILISNLEHNAVVRPVFDLNSEQGVEFDAFDAFAEDVVLSLKEKIKPNTKMIFCTHVSNVCGKILPIQQIGEFAHKNGLLFGVDAAQSAGVLPISMQKMHIDFLCVAAHKGLYSPTGIGILLLNKNIPKTLIQGGTGTNSIDYLQPSDLPERFESGTVNLPAIFGVGAGIDFINKKGIGNIFKHENMLCEILCEQLKKAKNITLYRFDKMSAPVVSFNVFGTTSDIVAGFLSDKDFVVRAGLHCAPLAHKTLGTLNGGAVRISPSVFNNQQEIEKIAFAIRKIAKKY